VRRVWLWTFLVLAIAGAAGFYLWQPAGHGSAAVAYRLANIDRGTVTATVRATGTLNPVTMVLVGSQLSGQVVEIMADYNSPVRAGQVLARLYTDQIETRRDAARADLAQANADVSMRRAQIEKSRALLVRAEATVRDQEAQRDRARTQLAEAKRNLSRQTELNERAVGTQSALDQARTQAEIQTAELASAEAQIASIQAEIVGLNADITLAEAQMKSAEALVLQRQAKVRDVEIDLARTVIRSPVDGVVVKRDVELGQTVAASLSAPTLFTVAQDLRDIDIYANIDEADIGRVKAGQSVSFTVSAYANRSFNGTVRAVRLGAQTVQNVVTYTAVIGVENSDQALLPGMTANLQIVTDERRDVLRVPNAALRFRPPAQPTSGANAASAVPEPLRARRNLRERIIAQVQPTPQQTAEIDRILGEARTSFPRREPGLSDEDRRGAAREIRQDLRRRIAAALDPERRAKLETLGAGADRGEDAHADASAPGRVYVLDRDGQPQPVALRLGVTDGSYTEAIAGDVQDGSAVIVGGGPRTTGQPVEPGTPSPTQRSRGPRLF
jgi:HlyD family secretion protein